MTDGGIVVGCNFSVFICLRITRIVKKQTKDTDEMKSKITHPHTPFPECAPNSNKSMSNGRHLTSLKCVLIIIVYDCWVLEKKLMLKTRLWMHTLYELFPLWICTFPWFCISMNDKVGGKNIRLFASKSGWSIENFYSSIIRFAWSLIILKHTMEWKLVH